MPDLFLFWQGREDKASLLGFNYEFLESLIRTYDQVVCLEGNDSRGLAIAILTKNGYNWLPKKVMEWILLMTMGLFDYRCRKKYHYLLPKAKALFSFQTSFHRDN